MKKKKAKKFLNDVCRSIGHSFPNNMDCERCGVAIQVFRNGILQNPGVDYKVAGANMVKFCYNPVEGDCVTIQVFQSGTFFRSNFEVKAKTDKIFSFNPSYVARS